MNDTSANPIFVALLFILRCVVPLAILFGVSYLLRKMGLVAIEAPEPPDELDDGNDAAAENSVVVLEDATTPPEESIKEGFEPSKANPNETPTVEKPKES